MLTECSVALRAADVRRGDRVRLPHGRWITVLGPPTINEFGGVTIPTANNEFALGNEDDLVRVIIGGAS